MTTPNDVFTMVTAIKTAMDITKELRNVGPSLEAAELKLRIADLVGALADAKVGLAEVQDIIDKKDERIAKLEAALSFGQHLVFRAPAYYETTEDDKPCGAPYCANCWESEKLAIHIHENPTFGEMMDCPKCKSHFPFAKRFDA